MLQGRPVVQFHGKQGRLVRVFGDTGRLNEGSIDTRSGVVSVTEEDGHNIVGMGCHPVTHFLKPVCDGSGIQEIATCVTEVRNRAVGWPLDLSLEEAYTVIELADDIQGLV